jgi:hypothetical protein
MPSPNHTFNFSSSALLFSLLNQSLYTISIYLDPAQSSDVRMRYSLESAFGLLVASSSILKA